MSEQKWTPGPWVRTWDYISAELPVDADGYTGQNHIALMMLGDDESDANAHLIACAPTMYDALVACERVLTACQVVCGLTEEETVAVEQARAVLARARGEAA